MWQHISRPPVEHVPTGELSLSILDASYHSARSSWRDGKRQRVEECLNAFVSSLYLTSDAIKANRIEWERRRKEAEEEERRRWEERCRLEEEAQRTKELEDVIRQWRFAQDVRAYVAEARKMVSDANLTITANGPLDKWLQFAASHAEKVAPLSGLRADIMKVLAEKPTTDASSGTPDAASSNETESG